MGLELTQLRNEIVTNPVTISRTVTIDDGQVSKTLPELLALGADGSIADALNAPTRTMASKAALTPTGVLGLLSPPSIANVWASANVPAILTAIKTQDHDAVKVWAEFALGAGKVTLDERNAVDALCDADGDPVPCSRAEELWGAGTVVTHDDVAAARVLEG